MKTALGLALAIALSPVLTGVAMTAGAAEIKVLSANGVKAVMVDLAHEFESASGNKVTLSFGEAGEIKIRIQNGEDFDVGALPSTVLDELVKQNKILAGSTVNIARSRFGMAVRAGAPKPDVDTADDFRRWLLAAKSIVMTDPATGGVSGVHFASILQRLGIADEMRPKLRLDKAGFNAEFVARGEAEIAVQAEHEIRCVSGVEFVQFPAEFQRTVIFAAGVGVNAKEPGGSSALVNFLTGPAAIPVIKAKCMEPG